MGKKPQKKQFKKFDDDSARELDAKKSLSPSSKPNNSKHKSKSFPKTSVESSTHVSEPNIPSIPGEVQHFDAETSSNLVGTSGNSTTVPNFNETPPPEQPDVTPASEELHFRQLNMNEGIPEDDIQPQEFEGAESAQQSWSHSHNQSYHQSSRQDQHGPNDSYGKPKTNRGYNDNRSNWPARHESNQYSGTRSFYNNDRKQGWIDRRTNQNRDERPNQGGTEQNLSSHEKTQSSTAQYRQPYEKGRRNSGERRDSGYSHFSNKNRNQKDDHIQCSKENTSYKDGGYYQHSNENKRYPDGGHNQRSDEDRRYKNGGNNQYSNERSYKGGGHNQHSNENRHYLNERRPNTDRRHQHSNENRHHGDGGNNQSSNENRPLKDDKEESYGQGSKYQNNDRCGSSDELPNRHCWIPPQLQTCNEVINDGDNWDEPQEEPKKQVTINHPECSWSEEVESSLQEQPAHNESDQGDTYTLESHKDTENIEDDHQACQTERIRLGGEVTSYQDQVESGHVAADWGDDVNSPAPEKEAGDYRGNYPNQKTNKLGRRSEGDNFNRRSDIQSSNQSGRKSSGNYNWRNESNESHNLSTRSVDSSWRTPKQRDPRMERRSLDVFDTSYEKEDREYKAFVTEERSGKKVDSMKLVEEEKDLFDMPKEYSFAHCVAEDMRMGSGIAVQFKREFKEVDHLLNQRTKQGGLALLEVEGQKEPRYIYYLVTKRQSTGKPTYTTFWSSLQKMRDHIKNNGVKKLAIPRLGCGLDRLDWPRVKHMIEFLFRGVDIEIVVCSLIQTEDDTPKKGFSLKLVNVEKPIQEIESFTIILYFSTEDGHISKTMTELDKKFNFLPKFRQTQRRLGDAIRHHDKNRNYILYGCIVRKTKNDLFDFVSLKKCLVDINKSNKADLYEYVALEQENDKDDLLHDKIITVLRYYLKKVDIYVCSSKDIRTKE